MQQAWSTIIISLKKQQKEQPAQQEETTASMSDAEPEANTHIEMHNI